MNVNDGDDSEHSKNLRTESTLGPFLGRELVEVTHEDVEGDSNAMDVHLHFDNGGTLTFHVDGRGFEIDTNK